MCQISRSGNRAFHGLLAIFQQRVHLIDKGLDFTGILSHRPAGPRLHALPTIFSRNAETASGPGVLRRSLLP